MYPRQRLDRAYRLCNDCEGKLHTKLSKISKWINQIYPVKFPTLPEPKPKVVLQFDHPDLSCNYFVYV